jgi:hypothetical protein
MLYACRGREGLPTLPGQPALEHLHVLLGDRCFYEQALACDEDSKPSQHGALR